MDSHGDEEGDYSDVVENLTSLFGSVLSEDVISAVVESCGGDLNLSMDAIMNITSDGNGIPTEPRQPSPPQATYMVPPQPSLPMVPPPQQPTSSYAVATRSAQSPYTGAIPKQIERCVYKTNATFWTNQIRNIIMHHNQGNRLLIIMRGVPGSGKTYLAKQLVDMMVGSTVQDHSTHIFSTDDYFMVRGQYRYDKSQLPEAHAGNQKRVSDATKLGLSPVIVDNTNVESWEMEPYVRYGVQNGYIIEILEPTTPWAKKANQLVKTNKHNVPLHTIRRMLDMYCSNVTVESLMNSMKLSYPPNMIPPVKRTTPPILKKEGSPPVKRKQIIVTAANIDTNIQTLSQSTSAMKINAEPTLSKQETLEHSGQKHSNAYREMKSENKSDLFNLDKKLENKSELSSIEMKSECNSRSTDLDKKTDSKSDLPEHFLKNTESDLTPEELERQKIFLEAQKRLEEIIKVENEWENGEHWEDDDRSATSEEKTPKESMISPANILSLSPFEAKPQRKPNSASSAPTENDSAESIMQTVSDCHDWSKISMFMPPWTDSTETSTSIANEDVPVEKMSNGTSMELGDTDINGKNKVITATARDINELHLSLHREKIPEKRMLDKSTMTNEGTTTEVFRCNNEEKHFLAFRKLFKNIARSDLRDIFDKCFGDVNWAVEIVLDGMNNNEFKTIASEELSDPEEEDMSEECECVAKYDIIPDVVSSDAAQATIKEETIPTTLNVAQSQKKKRDTTVSDETIQIKRQIEQNVVISDDHYSKHCLKIRKMRRGELDTSNDLEEPGASTSAEASMFQPTSSTIESDNPTPMDCSDDEDDISPNEKNDIVTINLGAEFVAALDQMFGRQGMQYPAHILPKVSIPMSLLEEINAVWMESMIDQIDEHAAKTAAMVQQDEEFARQLLMKEAELTRAGKEPEVPDFKEIMDMDLALALYQKDVDEWRNSMPTDMAAKMTRDKLYNLFPDVEKDTLSELLMAHDNCFNATVEVLLASMGRNDILEEENGINKFIAENELKQKDKILQQQRKELSETEWPLLSKNHKVDMSTVEAYRKEADQHLLRRNLNYQKAQDCIRRGMTQVASYYSEIANFHKQKYEYANGLAVASLMQFHALNNPDCTTIDLHYLRVKEAKESLDVFIDTHITKLRESGNRRSTILFFITGRGRNSQGRARIKPATMHRLRERGLGYILKNPGLLSATINVNTKLTHQISVP